jgi:ArsR family transcriptional regulator, cadmium/lead-responsive transcriptional repressor
VRLVADRAIDSISAEYSQICIMARVKIATSTDALARFGHALSDPTRTRVLLALRDRPAYPADLADLAGVSRQAMSNHLACLRGCGLVVAIPEGRRTRYELTDARIGHALDDLLDLVLVVDPECCGGETTATSEPSLLDTATGEVQA